MTAEKPGFSEEAGLLPVHRAASMPAPQRIDDLLDHEVVIDLRSRYVIAGRLVARTEEGLVLSDADVHDLHDTSTSREVYVVQLREHGIRPNRSRVLVRLDEVVAVSALGDVLH